MWKTNNHCAWRYFNKIQILESISACGANPGTASYRRRRYSLPCVIFVKRWRKQNWLSRVPRLRPARGDERRCALAMEKHLCRRSSTVFTSLKHNKVNRLCSGLLALLSPRSTLHVQTSCAGWQHVWILPSGSCVCVSACYALFNIVFV